jgi:molecular chaperone DnaK (HSP70)
VLEYRTKIKQYISELNQALNNKTEISTQQIKKHYKFLKETLRGIKFI